MTKISASKFGLVAFSLCAVLMTGCSSIPMASKEQDAKSKTFAAPAADKAGLYIFRNSFFGQALRKQLSVDGKPIGKTANKTFFHRELAPGEHTISTESEFGDNEVKFTANGGKNYFARQSIKMGVFVGGSAIEMVSEEEGKEEVLKCEEALAQ